MSGWSKIQFSGVVPTTSPGLIVVFSTYYNLEQHRKDSRFMKYGVNFIQDLHLLPEIGSDTLVNVNRNEQYIRVISNFTRIRRFSWRARQFKKNISQQITHRSILSIVVGCCKMVCCPDISTTHCVPSSSSGKMEQSVNSTTIEFQLLIRWQFEFQTSSAR